MRATRTIYVTHVRLLFACFLPPVLEEKILE